MRKFLAGIMATIIMIGTLAPVTFGLGGVQQKEVEAVDDPVYWSDIKVEPNGTSENSIKVSGYILYTLTGDPVTNKPVPDTKSDISIHISPADNPTSNWRNEDIDQLDYRYNLRKLISLTPTDESMLSNLEKDKEYVFWFEEENQQDNNSNDTQSEKIKFKIADLLNGVTPTVLPSINNGGSTKRVDIQFSTPCTNYTRPYKTP
jgi:hypothetical protein